MKRAAGQCFQSVYRGCEVMDSYRILVVDDEESLTMLLSRILRKEGYSVETAGDGQEAIDKLKQQSFNLVITDLKMPRVGGLTLVSFVQEFYPETLVVVLTAHGTIDVAVKAMKKGAWDFLTKPLENPDQLRLLVKKAKAQQQLARENLIIKESGRLEQKDTMIYHDPKMAEVMEMIKKVAPTDSTVLITGESGTGKEVVARQIHQLSSRYDKPFIAVNSAAIPENLLESELFGHEKGAFTGATAKKIGFFEMANEGTLFLDEIGDLSYGMQVKLLRVLQERTFTRVGGISPIRVNVRVIAATNKDLKRAVAEQSFRDDLYYRLSVFPVHIPPLRERKKDIFPLAEYFIGKYAKRMGKSVSGLTPEARNVLVNYGWPGNVRELSNVIERAVILCPAGEIITPLQLGISPAVNTEDQRDHKDILRSVERETIVKVLADCRGNRKKAASLLGISLRSLYYKLKEYNID